MMATAMAISTTTTKAHDHPPYKEMIVSAIESLKDRKGSSKTAIAKYIASNYNDLPPTHDALLTTHLRRLKQKGTIQMIKHSYKLAVLNDADSGPKKRGRPPKKLKPDNAAVGAPGPKKRGRPPKKLNPDNAAVGTSEKRKPGRPKKAVGDGKRKAGRPRKEMAPVAELILPRNLKLKLKPGRPKKANSADVAASGKKRKPGRPRKQIPAAATVSSEQRKPGRPKKASGAVENGGGSKLGEKRKPGRPKKTSTPLSSAVKGTGGPLGATKRRGRPPKEGKPAVVVKTGSEVKRSVGRPRKNVEA